MFLRRLKYLKDKAAFVKAGGAIIHTYPILDDYRKPAGTASGHYFHTEYLLRKKFSNGVKTSSNCYALIISMMTETSIETLRFRL